MQFNQRLESTSWIFKYLFRDNQDNKRRRRSEMERVQLQLQLGLIEFLIKSNWHCH